jgi:hypothetical protein
MVPSGSVPHNQSSATGNRVVTVPAMHCSWGSVCRESREQCTLIPTLPAMDGLHSLDNVGHGMLTIWTVRLSSAFASLMSQCEHRCDAHPLRSSAAREHVLDACDKACTILDQAAAVADQREVLTPVCTL